MFLTNKSIWSVEAYQKALRFAAHAHRKQMMPGQDLPYLLHLTEVCSEVMYALSHDTDAVPVPDIAIQCALLHDTIEDTETSYEDIKTQFGVIVADGVLALTKNLELPKELQMQDCLKRIVEQSAAIRIVKMADRIVNLQEPPYYWKREKRLKYQEEAKMILEKLQGVHPFIEQRLHERIEAYSNFIQK